jgi:hypothetical protein
MKKIKVLLIIVSMCVISSCANLHGLQSSKYVFHQSKVKTHNVGSDGLYR